MAMPLSQILTMWNDKYAEGKGPTFDDAKIVDFFCNLVNAAVKEGMPMPAGLPTTFLGAGLSWSTSGGGNVVVTITSGDFVATQDTSMPNANPTFNPISPGLGPNEFVGSLYDDGSNFREEFDTAFSAAQIGDSVFVGMSQGRVSTWDDVSWTKYDGTGSANGYFYDGVFKLDTGAEVVAILDFAGSVVFIGSHGGMSSWDGTITGPGDFSGGMKFDDGSGAGSGPFGSPTDFFGAPRATHGAIVFNGNIVVYADSAISSYDGVYFKRFDGEGDGSGPYYSEPMTGPGIYNATIHNSVLVFVGQYGCVASVNATNNWTTYAGGPDYGNDGSALGMPTEAKAITSYGDHLVIGTDDGRIASHDGSTWTTYFGTGGTGPHHSGSAETAGASALVSYVYKSLLVAVGDNGLQSWDGTKWLFPNGTGGGTGIKASVTDFTYENPVELFDAGQFLVSIGKVIGVYDAFNWLNSPFIVPTVPAGFNYTDIDTTTADLAWNPVPSATYYDLYRNYVKIATILQGTYSYHDTGLTYVTEYTYTIKAANYFSQSAASSPLVLTTLAPLPGKPTAVYQVSGYTTSNSLRMGWTTGGWSDYYKIYRDTVHVGWSNPGEEWFDDSSLASGTVYSYEIAGYSAIGEGLKSDPENGETSSTMPIYFNGSHHLGQSSVEDSNVGVMWGDVLIMGGTKGHVSSYSFTNDEWRDSAGEGDALAPDIYNDGTAMGDQTIYDMVVYNDTLIVVGGYQNTKSYLASCDLTTNTWTDYNAGTGLRVNNNVILGRKISSCIIWGDTLIIAGRSGYVGSCDLTTGPSYVWTNYNATSGLRSDGLGMYFAEILAMVVWNNNLIIAGQAGRVASCNLTSNTWVRYDGYVYPGGGTPGTIFNNQQIGGNIEEIALYGDTLAIIGPQGRVASCYLPTNTWTTYYAGSGLRNNGFALGYQSCLSCLVYNDTLVVLSREGYVASCDLTTNIWTNYNAGSGLCNDGTDVGPIVGANVIGNLTSYGDKIITVGEDAKVAWYDISDATWTDWGTVGGYLTLGQIDLNFDHSVIYNGNILIVGGPRGGVASCNLSTGEWSNFDGGGDPGGPGTYNDGTALGDMPIKDMVVYNDTLIIGGQFSRVASCDMTTNTWTNYDAGSGLRNDGSAMGNQYRINAMAIYGDILIVAGYRSYVASCDLTTNTWTAYNAGTGICNAGTALGNYQILSIAVSNDILVVGGGGRGGGRIASQNLTTYAWTTYAGTGGGPPVYDNNTVLGYSGGPNKMVVYNGAGMDVLIVGSNRNSSIASCDLSVNPGQWTLYDGSEPGGPGGGIYGLWALGTGWYSVYSMYVLSDTLVVTSRSGRLTSCDLTTNTWTAYNAGSGTLSNNGTAIGQNHIYTTESYSSMFYVLGMNETMATNDMSDSFKWYNYDGTTTP